MTMSRSETAAGEARDEGSTTTEPAIDVVLLARKVYELMRDALRLERARGAATMRQR